ncbi:hypothetical protein [Falsiroseomonas selenitidurans]|uniref:Glycosyltransferase RgtA/B/C/D-like domain-containing protein n=1 Tax=Falsiroseomonas selenitidurans TaxID=2716335 RepID=A0ABX1E3B5_9PROT|nr:hypothetical protein [Falsiroseomonas selenitidurans]NKC30007.1 hypothetical protein [Falsiroseomonas selenitidurans]
MILRILALLGGGLLLVWPAFLNGYPLLFSDTGAFLHQTAPPPGGPLVIWDKPHVYGPLLAAFHWNITLWGPLLAQGLALSHLLWLAQRALRGAAAPGWHLLACAGAAFLTTAPFTAALLMPDVFAPIVLLALLLLGFSAPGRGATLWLWLLGTVGIAAHLSHLPLALAVVVFIALVARRPGPVLRGLAPMAAAILLLLATNLWGHGRATLSPHGATFMLARLQADGPAAAVIRDRCPQAGWYLCAFADRLPMDSDAFLWEPDSPVNRAPDGTPRFLGGALLSAEAREIVSATLRTDPLAVARSMAGNALRQMALATVGDTLVDTHLATAVRPRIAEAFPAAELAAHDRSLQARGLLPAAAAPFLLPHAPVLLAGAGLALFAWWRALGDRRRIGLVVGVLVGVAANALATGGLSKPHLRYEARILWLMPVVAGLALLPRSRGDERAEGRAAVT